MSYKAYLDIEVSNLKLVIKSIIKNFEEENLYLLHRLDEALLEKAIIDNDADIVNLSVVAYCFRKLLSKKHIINNIKWPEIKQKLLDSLYKIQKHIITGDQKAIKQEILNIEKTIEHTDNLFGYFVQNLVTNSRTKIASSAYGYGLSLSKASKLLSVNKEQVMKIVGQTKMSDEDETIENIKKRVEYIIENKAKEK